MRIPVQGPTRTYYRRLGWAASRFAVLTDLAILCVGGKLKSRGMLSGRYADILAWQLIAQSALRRFEAEGRRKEDLPLVQYACEYALNEIQQAFEGIYKNFGAPVIGLWMKTVGLFLLRLNPVGTKPSDALTVKNARTLQKLSEQYHRITEDFITPPEDAPGAGRLMKAFRLHNEAEGAIKKISAAQKEKKLPHGDPYSVAEEAEKKGVITMSDVALLKKALEARDAAIQVDDFTPEEFFKTKGVKIAPGFN